MRRWSDFYSVDGSFSNDLNIEPSGSFKLYDLGDSHTNTTDTRYLDFSFSGANSYPTISQQVTGTGALAYVLALNNGDGTLQIKTNAGFNFKMELQTFSLLLQTLYLLTEQIDQQTMGTLI